MGKYYKFMALIFVFQWSIKPLLAQFSLSGEFRPRTEFAHGLKTLAEEKQDAALFTSQRTRLNLNYGMEGFKTALVLQDVRLWGSLPQLVGNHDFAMSVHQAWAEVGFCKSIALKAGRQELAYDNHRIFGNVGWAQQARSHDIALLKYKGFFNAHLGLAYHEDGSLNRNVYTGLDAYKAMQFLWINKSFEAVTLSFLILNNGVVVNYYGEQEGYIEKQTINYGQTIGFYGNSTFGPASLEANAYYQMGKDRLNKEISAFELFFSASFIIGDKLTFIVGYEHLSGTDWDETDVNNSFNPLYGTNHKFNGFMDYFYVGNHINSVGLNDFFAGVSGGFGKLSARADVHLFSAAARIDETAGNNLGTEIDFTLNYSLQPSVKLSLGYSQMFATEKMELIKGGLKDEVNNWAYLMLTVTPDFLK